MGIAVVLAGGAGCAAHTAPSGASGQVAGKDVGHLRRESKAQAARITELETRLALLEAEWRDGRAAARMAPRQTVVIGATKHRDDAAEDSVMEPPEAEEAPVTLILDERPVEAPAPRAPAAPMNFAATSVGGQVLPGLGVMPLPGSRAAGAAPTPTTATPEDPRGAYRQALALVRSQQFEQALVALSSFLGRYPTHRLADRALYWRGEVEYAQRQYARALQTFEALSLRYPESTKRADAMLKAGYCHRRLGDAGSAKLLFRRVRKEFPESEAARTAPGEGAS